MNNKLYLKYLWLAIGVFTIILLTFHWFGYDSQNLRNAILVFDFLMFVLSAPCGFFFVPVVVAANYYLGIRPISSDGIYLNTIFLFALGFTQWFWIVRFWSPVEHSFQTLGLLDGKSR